MKLIIDVAEDFNPKTDNILVFNGNRKYWELQAKDTFLKQARKEIEEAKTQISILSKRLDEANKNVAKMAEVLKKEISK